MDGFDFASAMSKIMTFMSTDLSSFYLNIAKDSLYCDKKDSIRRNQFQSVLYILGETLLRLLNPVLPFTMDEFNKNLPGERKENVQLLDYPKESHEYSVDILNEYTLFNNFKDAVNKAVEDSKNNGTLKSSNEADVSVEVVNDNYLKLFDNINNDLFRRSLVIAKLNIVKGLNEEENLGLKVHVEHAKGELCSRCRNFDEEYVKVDEETCLCKRCNEALG